MKGKADWILGINVAGHGASVCLLHKGTMVFFLKEERISRVKRDFSMPMVTLDEVSKYTKELDWVIFSNTNSDDQADCRTHLNKNRIKVANFFDDNPHGSEYYMDAEDDEEPDFSGDPELVIRNKLSTHHINHAACGYYLSPFDEATCVVMDGWGHVGDLIPLFNDEFYDGIDLQFGHRLFEHVTIFSKVRDDNNWKNQWELLYKEVASDAYRGSEYEDVLQSWGELEERIIGLYEKELNFSNVRLASSISAGVMYEAITGYLGFRVEDVGKVMGMAPYGEEDENLPPLLIGPHLDSNANLFHPSLLLNDIPYPQLKEYKKDFGKRANLAYAVQKALEEKVIYVIEKAIELSDCKNIVLTGGIFHNIMVNGMLVEKYPDYNFFADPLCDDSGHSYGVIKLLYDELTGEHVKENPNKIYFGLHRDPKKLERRIRKCIEKHSQ